MPHVRCITCRHVFYAAASHATLASCPECETVLSASQPGDVNAWLARRIIAEMPGRASAQAAGTTSSDSLGVDA